MRFFRGLLILYSLVFFFFIVSFSMSILGLWLSINNSLWFILMFLVFATFTFVFANLLLAVVYPAKMLFRVYPLLEISSKLFKNNFNKFRQQVIAYSNLHNIKTIKGLSIKDPSRVLILLPHCIQNSSCLYKVTWDKIENCRSCYKCQIPVFLKIKNDYGVNVVVVSGGTSAREIIKKLRPKFIIAVACENDLISGLRDINNIPVLGVLNGRPCGSCRDTTVDVNVIKSYLDDVLNV